MTTFQPAADAIWKNICGQQKIDSNYRGFHSYARC